jgi:protoporphyrinogen IX oxidase
MTMLWVKALHIIFVASWFAGLFYLPRILVNLSLSKEPSEKARLLLMGRKLYRFMGPLMVLALIFGLWLWLGYGIGADAYWMHSKLALVVLMIGYHHVCGRLLKRFEADRNVRSHVWYRVFNELSVLAFAAIVILVVVKPF